ncbi:hypothetical protein [Bradyrhizobium sp. CB3481]|uniref:hypothetical protein n=1 Tax=Bradyrhizobium sp. CB3481 TaxID=3039158 RepID=UPI0024B27194|nr:hypothetical protein [Bradyrhizobium sp. CB3481]WFU14947.1 hypothetical protein QA643_28765 [Bradyrhizobium sp. CB3481]
MRDVQMKRVTHRQPGAPAAAALFAAAICLISPAGAQTFSSSYTSTAPKDCRTIGKPGDNASVAQVCPGKAELVVVVSEDDLRQTVSVGPSRAAAAKEPAAETWFAPFNSTANTVEWRAVDGKPFAIIQRWMISDSEQPDKAGTPVSKPMLAVTRLPPGPVCHVAYIDGQANRNANELARQAADEFARDFKCGKDEVKVIGERGRAVDMAKPR